MWKPVGSGWTWPNRWWTFECMLVNKSQRVHRCVFYQCDSL